MIVMRHGGGHDRPRAQVPDPRPDPDRGPPALSRNGTQGLLIEITGLLVALAGLAAAVAAMTRHWL